MISSRKFTSKTNTQIIALFNYLSVNYPTATLESTAAYFHYHPNYLSTFIKNGLDHGEKKISIVLERKQEHAVLRISNQVIHSEQIDIEHVFDRFYKADVARSKTSTGLGLSIAKELVKRMNGEISAKIEKNEFAIELSFPLSSYVNFHNKVQLK